MKKSLLTITSMLVLLSAVLAMSGCKPGDVKVFNNNVGNDLPSMSPTVRINSGMSAADMFAAGNENYYGAKYVGSYQSGEITTTTVVGSTIQALSIRKVNDNGRCYMDNTSYTTKKIMGISIQLIDQMVVDTDGSARYRASKKCEMVNDELVAKKWDATSNYVNLTEMLAARPNDPTKMDMYIINNDTILSTTVPQFDKKTKQYTFAMTVNAVAASKNYDRVVKDQLANNSFNNASVNYKTLQLEVSMWENGFIRSIIVDETYDIKAGIISGSVSASAKTNFTYLQNEMPIASLIKF